MRYYWFIPCQNWHQKIAMVLSWVDGYHLGKWCCGPYFDVIRNDAYENPGDFSNFPHFGLVTHSLMAAWEEPLKSHCWWQITFSLLINSLRSGKVTLFLSWVIELNGFHSFGSPFGKLGWTPLTSAWCLQFMEWLDLAISERLKWDKIGLCPKC